MAVTHEDLHPSRRSSELGSKMGTFLIILTVLCGLCCFILCLVAESTRSQVRISPTLFTIFVFGMILSIEMSI